MSGNRLFLDTNAVIYLLQGDERLEDLTKGKTIFISAVTTAELFSKSLPAAEAKIVQQFVQDVLVIHTNDIIVRQCGELRQQIKIKIGDALIAASAMFLGVPLVSADKVFRKIEGLSFIELSV
jgi:predicted nucleic acid-binding protein